MTRSIHANVITEAAKDSFTFVSLIKMEWLSDSPNFELHLTDSPKSLVYSADTYASESSLIKIGDVSETAELRVGSLAIDFSAVDPTYPAFFLDYNYMDVRLRYWKAFVDSSYAIIGTPVLYFDGNISGFNISEMGSKSILSISCASHFANFATINGRKTNDVSQKIHFPNDKGLEFAGQTTKDILWGRK